MPFDKIDIESITEERRKSIAKSIRTISVEELKKLGNEVFHDLDDPGREVFFRFVAEHSHATIHQGGGTKRRQWKSRPSYWTKVLWTR